MGMNYIVLLSHVNCAAGAIWLKPCFEALIPSAKADGNEYNVVSNSLPFLLRNG